MKNKLLLSSPKKKKELIQLKHSDLPILKKKLHKKQKKKCPILKKKFKLKEMVVDHQHKRISDEIGLNGGGLVRGVIQFQANSLEGKITNAYKRYGLKKHIDLPSFLRNLADYLERKNLHYIHPNEKAKAKKLGKRVFGKLSKLYSEKYPKRKPLLFPKKPKRAKTSWKPKVTVKWERLLKEFNLE